MVYEISKECINQCIRSFKIWSGIPGSSNSEESACNAGYLGLTIGLGRSPGGGHGDPLQCSCLRIPWARGAWQDFFGVAQRGT